MHIVSFLTNCCVYYSPVELTFISLYCLKLFLWDVFQNIIFIRESIIFIKWKLFKIIWKIFFYFFFLTKKLSFKSFFKFITNIDKLKKKKEEKFTLPKLYISDIDGYLTHTKLYRKLLKSSLCNQRFSTWVEYMIYVCYCFDSRHV